MYGTPVLGANIGGIPELIRVGETGELYESGTAEVLKAKISKLMQKEIATQAGENSSFDNVVFYAEKILRG